MSEALWYYEESGKQAGPISQASMAEALRAGRLPAGSRVWRAGMAGWQPWEAVPELAALAAPPPVAGPPPLSSPPPSPGWGPPGAGAPSAPAGYGAPSPQWTPQPGGLARLEVATTVLLSVITLGIWGLVKFYECGQGYARLAPARASSFERLFWIYVGLGVASVIGNMAFAPLGFVLALAGLVSGVLLLNEVLAARDAAIAATGARVVLTSSGTHKVLWIGGAVLAMVVIGVFALIVQAVLFFQDHDKLAEALSRR